MSKLYAVRVIETRATECIYYVRAETPEEADRLALKGNTEESVDVPHSTEVFSREVWDFPTEVEGN